MTRSRWLPIAAFTLFAAWFAWLNRGERTAVDVGVFTFYRAPLTVILFLAFLAGMLSMLALSLRHDRRVRDELRRHGLLDAPPPAAPHPGAEWSRPREAPVEPPPAPAWPEPADAAHAYDARDGTAAAPDDSTAIYPRYDRDPAA